MNDYLREAQTNDPGAVKEAVVAIGDLLYRKESAGLPFDDGDREAVSYIKQVAKADAIPINRASAVKSLSRLRKAEGAEEFLGALRDPFWVCRFEGARALEYQSEERFAEPLRELVEKETRPEVRRQAVKALGKLQSPVAVKTLLEVFLGKAASSSKDLQVLAYFALRERTGLTYGYDESERWDTYYRTTFPASEPASPPAAASPRPAKDAAEAPEAAPVGPVIPAALPAPATTDGAAPVTPPEAGPGR